MRESSHHLSKLRQHVARLTANGGLQTSQADDWLATGHAAFDAALGGGLATGRVHEFFAQDPLDAANAAAFTALLALRAPNKAPLLWLRSDAAGRRAGHLYAPGMADLGGDPSRLRIIETRDSQTLLACANDAARCSGSAAVIVESWGPWPAFDLTAGRRLALGTRDTGATLLILRIDARPVPSVAETRWAVAAAASRDRDAAAPGNPVFDLELLRWRAGPAGGCWRMEWNSDEHGFRQIFADPPLSGAILPLSADRTALPRRGKAA